MTTRTRTRRVGCSPTFGSVFLIVVAVPLMWAGWVYLGPGTREGAEFVIALREHKLADACELATPEMAPRIRQLVRPRVSDGIPALAAGHGPRDYFHARANWTSRCLQFEGRTDTMIRVVYVTLEKQPSGWLVTDVSVDPGTTPICAGGD